MKPSAIKTIYKSARYQSAEVTLPSGETYRIEGRRERVGRLGWDRRYVWSFRAYGPGLAHAAHPVQRIVGWNGADYSVIDCVDLHVGTMTSAKRGLAALLTLLADA